MSKKTKEIEKEVSEETVDVIEAVEEKIEENIEPEQELSELERAMQKRMGHFEVNLSQADLTYIKNQLNNKIEWSGPNEAYLMIMSVLSISSELKKMRESNSTERQKVALPSTTLESVNFFLNRVTGKGEESAQRLFAVSMLLRPAMEEIRNLDQLIEKLEKSESEKKSA